MGPAIVDQKYRLLALLRPDTRVPVYLAEDLADGSHVVLKNISTTACDAEFLNALRNEFAVLSHLNHSSIRKVRHLGHCRLFGHYLIAEHIPGSPLSTIAGNLSTQELKSILLQLALVLDYLHSWDLLHRDISPENVLIRRSQDHLAASLDSSASIAVQINATLIDFGFAGPPRPRSSLLPHGTLPFMAPEVLQSSYEDHRSDLFSLGMTLLEPKYIAPVVQEDGTGHSASIDSTLASVLAKLTQPDPAARFGSARELVAALIDPEDEASLDADNSLRPYLIGRRLRGREDILLRLGKTIQYYDLYLRGTSRLTKRFHVIGGEAGIGKSRLIDQIRIDAELRGITTYHISCNPQGLDSLDSLYLLTALPDRHERSTTSLTDLTCQTSSTCSNPLSTAEQPESIVSSTGTLPTKHHNERTYALHSLAHALQDAVTKRPVALFFDDIQYADIETLELIRLLAAPPRGPMIFVTYRTDAPGGSNLDTFLRQFLARPLSQHHFLDRLSDADTKSLVCAAIGSSQAAVELGNQIHRLSGGNPLLVEEALVSLAKARIIKRAGCGWLVECSNLETIDLPSNLRAFAEASLAGLSHRLQRLLDILAVFRVRSSLSYLSEILRRDAASLVDDLEELTSTGVITRHRSELAEYYEFRHQCVREVVYGRLPAARRRELHREIADVIERSSPSPASDTVEQLAYHYVESMHNTKGPEYSFRAAADARDRHAPQRAIELLLKGLDLVSKDDLERRFAGLETLTELLQLVGDLSRAQHFYFEMLLLARTTASSEREALAIREMSRCLIERGDMQRGLVYAKDAEDRFRVLGDSGGEVTSMFLQAQAYLKLGDLSAASSLAEKGHEQSIRTGHLRNQAFAMTLLGLIATERGDHEKGIALNEGAHELSSRANDANGVAVSLSNLGLVYLEHSLLAQAKHYFEMALEEARSKGLSIPATLALVNLGEIDRLEGDISRAEVLFNEALTIADAANRKYFSAYASFSLGVCKLLRGDFTEAQSHFSRSESLQAEAGHRPDLTWVLISKAEMLLQLNRLESALSVSREALDLAQSGSNPRSHAAARAMRAGTLLHKEAHRAFPLVTESRMSEARRAGKTQSLARILEARAALRLIQGEPTLALVDLSEMRSIAEETGLKPELARAALLEGQALMQLNRRAEARLALEAGAGLAREMGLRPLLSHLLYWLSQAQEAAGDAAGAADSIFESADLINAMAGAIAEDDLRRSYLEASTSIAVLSRAERLVRAGMQPRSVSSTAPADPDALAGAAFSDVGRELGAGASLRGLLTAVLDKAIEAVRADRGMLILLDPLEAEVTIARNLEGETLGDAADYCRSILQDVARGDPILAMDVPGDERFRTRKSVTLYDIQSLMCVPLTVGERVLGALYFDSRSGRRLFREEDLHLMQAFAGRVAEAISEAQQEQRLREGAVVQNRELAKRYHMDNLVGESPVMQRLFRIMETVIRADCNVLVVGESGTGKELVARAVHFGGSRRLANFVPLDCGAIPESLVESELFGYRRGAFTGAECDKKGLFEEADGGTLFLDEITNTSPAFQAKLLRALQSGEFRRLGETLTRRADVRIIAATNAQVDRAIKEGRFREDLYYRLNVVTLTVPPLRDRKGDIPLLAEHFARRCCESSGIRFEGVGRGALARLQAHTWPGNVRELEHCIEAALVVSGDGMVRRECLPERVLGGELDQVRDLLREECLVESGSRPEQVGKERTLVEEALIRAGGDKSRAARLLGWNRMRLYRRMKALGISYDVGKQTA